MPSFDLGFCYLPPPSPLSFLEKRKKAREKEKRTSALSVRVAVPSPRHGVTEERVRLLVGCSALCLTWWSWAGQVRRGSAELKQSWQHMQQCSFAVLEKPEKLWQYSQRRHCSVIDENERMRSPPSHPSSFINTLNLKLNLSNHPNNSGVCAIQTPKNT